MTERIWEDLLSEQDKQVISAAGYDKEGASSWDSRGLGENPMVLVIDMQRLVFGDDVPILDAIDDYRTAMGDIAWDAIDHIQPFVKFARDHDVPVAYSRVVPSSYDDPDHPDLDIVDPVEPEDGEPVIDKTYASVFYDTELDDMMEAGDHDTLVIVGNSTSGCVRATTVDAKQHGYSVVLPQECIFDRIQASHKVGLLDMWMKYAEVVETAEAQEYIESLR